MTEARGPEPGRRAGRVPVGSGGAGGIGAATSRRLSAEGAAVVVAGDGCVAEAERRFGLVSVLVNSAGVVHSAPLGELTRTDYRRVVDVEQAGVLLGMRAVLP